MKALVLGGVLAVATVATAQPTADPVRFATDVEKARAHLLVSEQLYMLGEARAAALHAAHPVHELGNRLIGPVRRVESARADRLREALKEPGRAIESKVPPARYVATVASVAKALDDAVTQVVGAEARARSTTRFRKTPAAPTPISRRSPRRFRRASPRRRRCQPRSSRSSRSVSRSH